MLRLPQVSKQQRCLDSRAHGEHGMLTEKCDEDSDVAAAQTLQRQNVCVLKGQE